MALNWFKKKSDKNIEEEASQDISTKQDEIEKEEESLTLTDEENLEKDNKNKNGFLKKLFTKKTENDAVPQETVTPDDGEVQEEPGGSGETAFPDEDAQGLLEQQEKDVDSTKSEDKNIVEEEASQDISTKQDEIEKEEESLTLTDEENLEKDNKNKNGFLKKLFTKKTENDAVPQETVTPDDGEVQEEPGGSGETAFPDEDAQGLLEQQEKDVDSTKSEELTKQVSFFSRLKKGLSKTRKILTTDIDKLFTFKKKIDDDMLEELEELLVTSDIGINAAMDIIETVSKKASKISCPADLKEVLKEEILSLFGQQTEKPKKITGKPQVVMVIGVNGVGKTTTIGKLAARATASGKKVLIAAADTFRAAAVEQLVIWAEKAGADIVRHKENTDPAAVAYDSIEAAMARNVDLVLIDTAGRLHTKVNLMEELKKIKRAVSKKMPEAPHETLLVLDATTGQNSLSQARLFHEEIGVSEIAVTKLDGTAKGGVVVAICNTLKIPLKYIGMGEKIEDLHDFNPEQFIDALFS